MSPTATPATAPTVTSIHPRRSTVATICIVLMTLWTLFFIYGTFTGMANVGQQMQQHSTELERNAASVGAAIGLGTWSIMWFIPTVGLGIIALGANSMRRPN
jgi:hypothetical protein